MHRYLTGILTYKFINGLALIILVIIFMIVSQYANQVNYGILLVKSKKIERDIHYQAFRPTVQVLSTLWPDSRVVWYLSEKVNYPTHG